jgi:2-succinyl-5-enolpyruvyl-6-hydroxy-3-cyclohexene-1-carboxylate synthase
MAENAELTTVNAFVRELHGAGVRHVCLSPGSRSTPLTIALARLGEFEVWTLLDERSAAYFALGLARETSQPVVLVCTSGTATANYFPAIMEASQTHVPLIVMTADRPPELQAVGSNQTVDQTKLYGTHVKWFLEMPVPQATQELIRHARTSAHRVVARAMRHPAGPVHVNWPFREPLVPPQATGLQDKPALDQVFAPELHPSPSAMDYLEQVVNSARHGMIVCGPQDDMTFPEALVELAKAWGVPILADPLSQLRCGYHALNHVVDTYDLLLRHEDMQAAIEPDVILRFGRTPTSKALGQFLSRHVEAVQVVISEEEDWNDPFFSARTVVLADSVKLCKSLVGRVRGHTDSKWMERWAAINKSLQGLMDQSHATAQLSEPGIVRILSHMLPRQSTVFVGNSMPIRDFDTFLQSQPRRVRFLANRGVSGIDGVVSSAIGVAASAEEPVILIIGDVSFYHDLNGLYAAYKYRLNLLIILVHNDGGGIFSFLPQAQYPETFEHFQTSHGLGFEPVVKMYGGDFVSVSDSSDFRSAVDSGLKRPGISVVEVRTTVHENVQFHRQLIDDAKELVRDIFEG